MSGMACANMQEGEFQALEDSGFVATDRLYVPDILALSERLRCSFQVSGVWGHLHILQPLRYKQNELYMHAALRPCRRLEWSLPQTNGFCLGARSCQSYLMSGHLYWRVTSSHLPLPWSMR